MSAKDITANRKRASSGFIKARGITWPEYFDENKRISQRFEIDGIPAMWLINKRGLVANINARDDMQGRAEELLAQ